MSRTEAITAIRRDRDFLGQLPLPVREDLQRTRLFRFAEGGVMAAGNEDHCAVVQPDTDLVRVDTGVDRLRLHDLRARRCVGVDTINPKSARIAERDQQVLGRNVGGHVDRAGRQCDRIAMRGQSARSGINTERTPVLFVAGRTHTRGAVARRDVEEPARSMWPSVVNVRRQRHRASLGQCGGVNVHIIVGQLRPDAGVERYFMRVRLA